MAFTTLGALRTARNSSLAATDHWMFDDNTKISSKEAIESYRQGLRDIPSAVKLDSNGDPELNSNGNLQDKQNIEIELPAEIN